uniref:receptor-like protein Cf-9 isoform X2 n=1 Tax=Erigeron canadensis TaxID=72917 RepID=UPI001CB89443|nr:receptor-like protein Cf-9 isoform X2 [Erigeron canadensis]
MGFGPDTSTYLDLLGSDYYPVMNNWNTSIDCCNWNGVTCDDSTGDVIRLDLGCGMLRGTVHSNTSLFHLSRLQGLDLGFNDIKLEPRAFTNMLQNYSNLEDLWLTNINIGLALPTYTNFSSSLKQLDLSSTGLHGKLPVNLFDFLNVEELILSMNNNLTGPLPKVNTSTSNPLVSLDLSSTSLSGKIPESIGYLNSLMYLDLSDCGLTGSLPKSLVNLRNLSFLYLSSNMLSGTLPSSLFTLPSLKYIRLRNNMFIGNIPVELFSLQSIKGLSLGNNQLSGQTDVLGHRPISQTFRQLTNLTYIDLSSNHFRGDWDLDILLSSLTNLEELHLSLSGLSVSSNNAKHYVNPKFKLLSLSSCKLNVFPESLQAMKNLKTLDLSNNDIHGHIPEWIGEMGGNSLLILDLSNNSISGTIPNVFNNYAKLEGFIVNENQLEGEVPSSLSNCQKLRIIDLGKNHLNDTFPGWLGSLPDLQALVLDSNSFHGRIATFFTIEFPFPSLRVLVLSHNEFEGELPLEYLQSFNAMKNVVKNNTKPEYLLVGRVYYSIVIAMKGVEQDFPYLLVEYTIIDLSNNNFESEIPDIIGNLNSLKVLNLSHNSLTGQIPRALGKLSEIESLDLSWNQLTGEIPQSLADLTFLSSLNLSQNLLMGRIPQGNQFSTFQGDSFGGNPKLCGPPLPSKCEVPRQPQVEGDGDDVDQDGGLPWKVVMLGYGCGTLVGLVLGYLMLSTGRPRWFNAIADATSHMILRCKPREDSE